ncbi:hypothetical protein KAU33_14560, partial [Candidatus Dependentiae bacterium]|nr:hypothetical protein [Candidatus Dependentiae bacterium]
FIFQQEMDRYSKNQDCIHITFPPPNPPTVSFLRDDINPPPIIERFEMPSENFYKYDYAQYYFKKDSSGKIHFLELYKHYSGGYKTKFYLGTFNNETYEFQKREIGNLDFNSFADFDIDNDGNIYVFYKSGEYIYPTGNDEVSIVKIEQETLPELKVVFDFKNDKKKPENYLPIKDDLIPFTIKIVPDDEDKFFKTEEKYDVKLLIRDTNGNEYSQGAKDKFAFENKTYEYTVNDLSLDEESGEINLIPDNYYGVAQIYAQIEGQKNANTIEIPIDTDNDIIADSWENTYSNVSVGIDDREIDNETLTGVSGGEVGDGFKVFQEYKGLLRNDSDAQSHFRLNPDQKEIFIVVKTAPPCSIDSFTNHLSDLNIVFQELSTKSLYIDSDENYRFIKGSTEFKYNEGLHTGSGLNQNGLFKDNPPFFSDYPKFAFNRRPEIANGGGIIYMYHTTIMNIFSDANLENERNTCTYFTTVEGRRKRIVFNNTDLDDDNDDYIGDDINIWDLVDDKGDNKIFDISMSNYWELYNYACLHEMGNIFALKDKHPSEGINTIMIGGSFSKYRKFYYSETEKSAIKTYREMR